MADLSLLLQKSILYYNILHMGTKGIFLCVSDTWVIKAFADTYKSYYI